MLKGRVVEATNEVRGGHEVYWGACPVPAARLSCLNGILKVDQASMQLLRESHIPHWGLKPQLIRSYMTWKVPCVRHSFKNNVPSTKGESLLTSMVSSPKHTVSNTDTQPGLCLRAKACFEATVERMLLVRVIIHPCLDLKSLVMKRYQEACWAGKNSQQGSPPIEKTLGWQALHVHPLPRFRINKGKLTLSKTS